MEREFKAGQKQEVKELSGVTVGHDEGYRNDKTEKNIYINYHYFGHQTGGWLATGSSCEERPDRQAEGKRILNVKGTEEEKKNKWKNTEKTEIKKVKA